jgi:hypothetical protein
LRAQVAKTLLAKTSPRFIFVKTCASVAPSGLFSRLNVSIRTSKIYQQRLGVQQLENVLQKENFSCHASFLSSAPLFLEGERLV